MTTNQAPEATINTSLKMAILASGYSLREVAKRAKITYNKLCKVRGGFTACTEDEAERLAVTLGRSRKGLGI